MSHMLLFALAYARRGWFLVPSHDLTRGQCSCAKGTECSTPAKHPRLTAWQTKGTTDERALAHWWTGWPQANISIVTGYPSRLGVLDVDPRNGGDVVLDDLQRCYATLPETPMVLSGGGGQHYYFRLDDETPTVDLAHGLEFLADGGHQVIAPPSLHPSGRRYEWEVLHDLDDMPLAPVPAWIQALVHEKATAPVASCHISLPDNLPAIRIDALTVSDRIKHVIRTGANPEGFSPYPSRSEALFAVLHALIDAGYDDATIAALVLHPANGISDKPLSQKNVRSPRYIEQTRGWIAGEIARARSKTSLRRTIPAMSGGRGRRPTLTVEVV